MAHNTIKSPPLSLLTRFLLFLYGWLVHVCTRRDGTFNSRLFSLADFKTSAPATKRIHTTRVSTADITVDPSHNLWFRLFTPSTDKAKAEAKNSHSEELLPLIVYFHGGGFTIFGADSMLYDNLCSRLAAGVHAVVVSVNYRLAPEHKYPSQYEDGFDVLKFIDAKYSDFLPANTDLSKCFVGGDSAGGNIAHHVTVKALQNGEQFCSMRIIGIIGLQPFFGGEERTESELKLTNAPLVSAKQGDAFWRAFLPEGADRDHPAANVYGGGANSAAAAALKNLDFPRCLVIVGGNDPVRDCGRRYVEWLKDCGNKWCCLNIQMHFIVSFYFPIHPSLLPSLMM